MAEFIKVEVIDKKDMSKRWFNVNSIECFFENSENTTKIYLQGWDSSIIINETLRHFEDRIFHKRVL